MGNTTYEEAAFKAIEQYNSKILKEIHKGVSDSGMRLLKLVEIIPNWETYLTPKQLQVMESYIKCLNACEVDYQLKLNSGTTQQRLFGNSTNKGAIGRLEETIKRLEQQGYFEKQKRMQEKQKKINPTKVSKITDKTKSEIRELIKLVVEMPEYEIFLTNSQKERIYQFLRLRSIKACAKYFNITEITFKQSLLGRNGDGGILGRLKKASEEKMVSKWEEL